MIYLHTHSSCFVNAIAKQNNARYGCAVCVAQNQKINSIFEIFGPVQTNSKSPYFLGATIGSALILISFQMDLL
jgi:hypothetical protein